MPLSKRTCLKAILAMVVLMLSLVACNLPASGGQDLPVGKPALLLQTAQVLSLQAAETASEGHLPSTVPSLASQAPTNTEDTPSFPAETTDLAESIPTKCDLAMAGNPIDITIPDDSTVEANQAFTKIWRLENVGTCTWSDGYLLGHFSGDTLGARTTIDLDRDVHPGEIVELSIDMVAPENAGTYQSNWKMRNPSGEWFGIGPIGDAPIWVRIIVVPQVTAITATGTASFPLAVSSDDNPVILVAGSVVLRPDDQIDLDHNRINPDAGSDLIYQISPDGKRLLLPLVNTDLSYLGTKSPGYEDCTAATPDSVPLVLEDLPANAYLCYRTAEGNPGWIRLAGMNALDRSYYLDMVTWKAP